MSVHHRRQANDSRSTRWDEAHLAAASALNSMRPPAPPVLPARYLTTKPSTITSLAAQRTALATRRHEAAAADETIDRSPTPAAVVTDEFDWDDVLTLPRAAVRSRTRLGSAVSRSMHRGHGRRNLAIAGLFACCALTAACGSATRLARPEAPATALVADRALDDARLRTSLPREVNPRDAASALPAPPLTPGLRAAGRIRTATRSEATETAAVEPRPEVEAPAPEEAAPRRDRSLTRLVAFQSAPFPYEGLTGEGTPFLNVAQGDQRGHRGRRGQVLWADRTFSDNRALVHVPARFDPSQPGAMVVFFHGYGATLSRDVAARQQVPQQVTASGANVVLVAPQFASDARDPSAGHFWEPGGCARFLDEAARQVAAMRGVSPAEIGRLPLVFVPYSGGFYTAALCLKDPAVARRTRDVLMLDAAYGDLETYADWAASRPGNVFVSGYTHYTARQNAELRGLMAARGVAVQSRLSDAATRGGAAFLPADTPHNDYVTQAWTDDPIRDLLAQLPGLRGRDPQSVAAVDMMPTGSLR